MSPLGSDLLSDLNLDVLDHITLSYQESLKLKVKGNTDE
jgi:hypothetical protein